MRFALNPAVPETVGEMLDRFELISQLASGGMATVFLARLVGLNGFTRLCAIKRLHPHLASDGELIEMFLDEARLAARIHHPNVVPILEIGITPSGYYLVMEYIEGDTVARLFARSAHAGMKLPTGVGIRIMLDALAGLHAAHELKDDDGKALEIVHRDVSPQNILVGVDGVSRLTDFGVARAASRLSTTRSGQLKGKLAYMAPEQAKAGKIDRRTDVFAMGICLWETLAFKRLFKGEGEAETLNRVLHEPIPELRAASPTVPSSLNAIVMKALERDPEKRFGSAAELADALEKAAQALKVLGTQRDVIACVEQVMGAELVQQREVVRTWLARSEPSRLDSSRPPGVTHESVTRVERGAASVAPPPVPPATSSVSSATLDMKHTPLPSAVADAIAAAKIEALARARIAPAAKRGRSGLIWSAALVATVAVIGTGVITWKRAPAHGSGALARGPLEPGSANVTSATSTKESTVGQEPESVASPIVARAADVAAVATGAASATAPAPKAAGANGAHPRHTHASVSNGSNVASATGAAAASASSKAIVLPDPPPAVGPPVPDDITHNPYR